MKNKILVIGAVNQDIVIKCNQLPMPGETVEGRDLQYFTGGKGMNQAVAAGLYGGEVHYVGKIGNDHFGSNVNKFINSLPFEKTIERLEEIPTGIALISLAPDGENSITIIKGANDEFKDQDLKIIDQFSEKDILLMQNEINTSFNHKAIEKAFNRNMITIYNPAPTYKIPKDIISKITYLIVNEHELREVFSIEEELKESTIRNLLLELSKQYNTNIILTIGEKGSLATYNNSIIETKGLTMDVLDTTGAGDCFCGTLAAALSNNKTLKEALEIANLTSAYSVMKIGANSSYINMEEIERLAKR
ncbi:MAG: ribokinase [Hyphomicrobiales bacterium]